MWIISLWLFKRISLFLGITQWTICGLRDIMPTANCQMFWKNIYMCVYSERGKGLKQIQYNVNTWGTWVKCILYYYFNFSGGLKLCLNEWMNIWMKEQIKPFITFHHLLPATILFQVYQSLLPGSLSLCPLSVYSQQDSQCNPLKI